MYNFWFMCANLRKIKIVTMSLTNLKQAYQHTTKVRNYAIELYMRIFVRKSRARVMLRVEEATCKLTGTRGKHCS